MRIIFIRTHKHITIFLLFRICFPPPQLLTPALLHYFHLLSFLYLLCCASYIHTHTRTHITIFLLFCICFPSPCMLKACSTPLFSPSLLTTFPRSVFEGIKKSPLSVLVVPGGARTAAVKYLIFFHPLASPTQTCSYNYFIAARDCISVHSAQLHPNVFLFHCFSLAAAWRSVYEQLKKYVISFTGSVYCYIVALSTRQQQRIVSGASGCWWSVKPVSRWTFTAVLMLEHRLSLARRPRTSVQGVPLMAGALPCINRFFFFFFFSSRGSS